MNIDVIRSFKVPFLFANKDEGIQVYLIAFGITLGVLLLNVVVAVGAQLPLFLAIPFMHTSEQLAAVVAGVGVLIAIIVGTAVLVVAMSVPAGYIYETIKRELQGEEYIMPSWKDNYKRFFWHGLRLLGSFILYSLVLLVAFLLLFAAIALSSIALGGMFGDGGYVVSSLVGLVLAIVIATLYIVFWFYIPMAFVHLSATDSIRKSFDVVYISKKIINAPIDFLIATGVAFVYFMVLYAIVFILCMTVIGGLLIGLLWMFVMPITVLNLYAQVYKVSKVS